MRRSLSGVVEGRVIQGCMSSGVWTVVGRRSSGIWIEVGSSGMRTVIVVGKMV